MAMIVTLSTNLLAQWLGLYVCPGRSSWTYHRGQGRLHEFSITIEQLRSKQSLEDYWLGQMHWPGEENSQCTDIEATEVLAAKTIKATLS
jgi:hypothetical protein